MGMTCESCGEGPVGDFRGKLGTDLLFGRCLDCGRVHVYDFLPEGGAKLADAATRAHGLALPATTFLWGEIGEIIADHPPMPRDELAEAVRQYKVADYFTSNIELDPPLVGPVPSPSPLSLPPLHVDRLACPDCGSRLRCCYKLSIQATYFECVECPWAGSVDDWTIGLAGAIASTEVDADMLNRPTRAPYHPVTLADLVAKPADAPTAYVEIKGNTITWSSSAPDIWVNVPLAAPEPEAKQETWRDRKPLL